MNNTVVRIGDVTINKNSPVYFIADVAANHDGDLSRAKKLIKLAKDAGADAVKMQHHNVKKYVSKFGFENLGEKKSHQSSWKKSIFEVYKDAEVPLDWTEELKKYSDEVGVEFLSTPYDLDMVDHIDPFVNSFKIGSGDLNWDAMLEKVAKTAKPVLIATGACVLDEVKNAIDVLTKFTDQIVLFQCNTNYTGSIENFSYINLNVLKSYAKLFPNVILGLSDHTPGHLTVLGAVALGAKVVEKHFTDDTSRPGPDHPFSMDFTSWKAMVDETRVLELALGDGVKRIEMNEKETVVLQRRAIRVVKNMNVGDLISMEDVEFQRPAPADCYYAREVNNLLNKRLKKGIVEGDYLRTEHIQ